MSAFGSFLGGISESLGFKGQGAIGNTVGRWMNNFNGVSDSLSQSYGYNSALAQQNREWQEHMSNTAHQREVADLKKAGLNPILSATGGNGASTPSGGVGSVSSSNSGTIGDFLNSAKANKMANIELKRLGQELKKQESDISNNTRDSKAYSDAQNAMRDYYKSLAVATSHSAKNTELQNKYLENTLPGRVTATNSGNSLTNRNNAFDASIIGQLLTHGPKVFNAVGSAVSGLTSAFKSDKTIKGYNYYDKHGSYTGSRENVY